MNINSDNTFKEKAAEIVSQLTLDEKLMMLTTHHSAVERLGLGEFYIGTEVARGYVGRTPDRISTVFPQPVGLASTFDTQLMYELGGIAANEARAYYNEDKRGGLALWGPTVDMVRDPRWGRTEEAYGEDVCLAGEMTAAYTKGMAGDNGKYLKTIPTLKHFCANNNEEKRGNCNAYLPLRLKYEYYYAAFMNAIKFGGAKSIMAAYNEINGVPAICNPELKTVLKDKWGLWFAVSDGEDFSQTVTAHRYCESHSEAFMHSLKAGCDTMTDNDLLVREAAKKALADGMITEKDIDESLNNTVYARLKLGQLADDCPYDSINKDIIDNEEYRQTNLRATLEQIILLKNDGILPLKSVPKKIAIVGPLADENLMDWYTGYSSGDISVKSGIELEFPETEAVYDSLWDYVAVKAPNGKYLSVKENGEIIADADRVTDSELFELQNWGENWNNLFSVKYRKYVRLFDDNTFRLHNRKIYDWFTRETINIHEYSGKYILEEFLNSRKIVCDKEGKLETTFRNSVKDDCLFDIEVIESGRDRAEKFAAECDLIVYCVGNHPVQVAKECHDRRTLSLNIRPSMAEYLASLNSNVVMTLISSYPYSICSENEKLPAIIYTSHAGAHLGTAVAKTIKGENNPAGRTSLTWYRSEHDLPGIMEYDIENAKTTYMYFDGDPLYPFGYGLSYSQFVYKKFDVFRSEAGITADVTVSNSSGIDGDEVVQIYYAVRNSALSRPEKKLCGFARVHIKAGDTADVRIQIPEHILQVYNTRNGKMITENGEYLFFVGASSADLRLEQSLAISDGEYLGVRSFEFEAQSYDEGVNIRIFYSKNYLRHYIRAVHGNGKAVYKGVNLSGVSRIKITAQSTHRAADLQVHFDDKHISSLTLIPSDSFDDFKEYIFNVPEGVSDINEIALIVPDSAGVLDISFE